MLPVGAASGLDYHIWRAVTVQARGQQLTVFRKPGMSTFHHDDVAALLVADQVEVAPGESALVLNGGDGTVGLILASQVGAGAVRCASTSLLDVEAMTRTFNAAAASNARAYHSAGTAHVPDLGPVDVVVARLPRGRRPLLQLLRDAFLALRPGGRFYLAGANDDGIQSALKRVGEQFGGVDVLAYRQGSRLGRAVASATPGPLLPELADPLLEPGQFYRFTDRVRGVDVEVCSRPGVFGWDKVDDGSRALAEALEVKPGDRILDLGCGTGVVGVIASRLAETGATYLVDADVEAIDSARATADANAAVRCVSLASDVCSAVRDQRFDLVVANPPFHVGRSTETDVALAFIADAASVLADGGRLCLVANAFLPYEAPMRAHFADPRTVAKDRRYKVLVGQKRRPTR